MYNPDDSGSHVRSHGRIAAELQRLAPLFGYSVVDNVVFTRGLISAAVDHVAVDRWGVLVIDAESHEGASVLGTDTDTKWTATYPNGQVAEFRNPLFLNTGNENLVKQALADSGIALEPSEIRSAVVFAGSDLSRLSLVEVNSAKVRGVENLSDIFEARRSFPPNGGRLTGADIDRIVSFMSARAQVLPVEEEIPSGPWLADPAVVASTQAAMLGAPPASNAAQAVRATPDTYTPTYSPVGSGVTSRSLELAGHHTDAGGGPSTRAALLTLGTIAVIILTVVAGAVFFPQLKAGSTAAWTATLVLFVALAELIAANIANAPRNAGKPRPGGRAGAVVRFVLRMLLAFVLVAGAWMFVAGGVSESIGASLAARFAPADPNAPAAELDPGVVVAKRRLREKAPQVYKRVSNLNTPSIHPGTKGRTSYTWSYTPSGSSVPASFTLTIDGAGELVSP